MHSAHTVLRVLRRTRVFPVALAALVLGIVALAAPIAPYDDDARSTAALTAGADDELVPATGDWTQDGVRAPSSAPSASGSASASSPGSAAPAGSTGAPSPSAPSSARTSSSASTSPSASDSPSAPVPSSSSPSSSAPRPPTPGADRSSAPVETPALTLVVEAPVVDPAEQVLAIVDAAREAAGCAALSPDAALAAAAAELSAAMADGGGPPDSGTGTVVVATGTDPEAVGATWAADPALLDCALTTAGVGTTDGWWALVAA